ncbi:MAG: hypothetical protein ACXWWU_10755 [Candidatus Limnocylindria bacterium]
MSDDWRPEQRELRPRPPERRTARPIPWLMIGGVILLAILALVLAILVLGGGRDDPGASKEPSPSIAASVEPRDSASATPSVSDAPTSSPSAEAQPSVAPIELALDTIVVTTVDDLTVRAAAGTGAERLGSVANGAPSYVAGGPVDADGYRWYLVSGLQLPPNTGCAGPFETDPYNCPVWFGWVASGSPDGTAWLEAQPQECAEAPFEFEEIVIGVTDLMRLACFGSDAFTFRAWWPEIPDDAGLGGACVQDAPSGWLICHTMYDVVMIDDSQDFGGIGLGVSIDPASGVSMPERGTWLELTVHLDDPTAQSCDDDAVGVMAEEQMPEAWVLFCRGKMVVESVTAVDGP